MRKRSGKENRDRAAAALRRLVHSRGFLWAATAFCALMMLVSAFSIVRSLVLMRAVSQELPVVAAEADPYYLPPETPGESQAPVFFIPAMLTPEHTPESPFGWKEHEGARYFFLPNGYALTGLHRIDGKLRYFNERGQCAESLGVDVSYHNKSIDWDAVRADGIDFAIVRLGYRGWETGILHPDTDFEQNLRGAKEAGLRVGVYVYSTAVNAAEANEEASFVLAMLNGFPLDLPVYFDTEQSGEYPNGRADRLSKATGNILTTEKTRLQMAATRLPSLYANFKLREEARLERTLTHISHAIEQQIRDEGGKTDILERRLALYAQTLISRNSNRLEVLENKIKNADPERILQMGFTLTRSNGKVVKDASKLKPGDRIDTTFINGTLTSIVQ